MSKHNFYKKIPTRLKTEFRLRFILEHFLGFYPFKKPIQKWGELNHKKILRHIPRQKTVKLEIDKLDNSVSEQELKEKYVSKGIPVIIKEGIKKWECYEEWSFDFFKQNYGEHPIILSNMRVLGDEDDSVEFSDLATIIEEIEQNSKKYIRFNPLIDKHPELKEDMKMNWYQKVRTTNLLIYHVIFFGNQGTHTNIHNAVTDNLFALIRGRKRWHLWDPEFIYALNPKVNRGPAKSSPHEPRVGNEPCQRPMDYVPYYEFDLEESDILYLPSYYWHYVYNLTPSIGMGHRWLNPTLALRKQSMLSILETFNINPTIFKTLGQGEVLDFNEILLKNKNKL